MNQEAAITTEAAALARILLRWMRRVALVGFTSPAYRAAFTSRERDTHTAAQATELPGSFDAVFFDARGAAIEGLVAASAAVMDRFGAAYFILPAGHCTAGDPGPAFADAGLLVYAKWRLDGNGGLHFATEKETESAAVAGIVMAVRDDYDPIRHARVLFKSGHPGWSLEVLENVPEALLTTGEAHGLLASEKMLGLLAWDQAAGAKGRLNRFARAQDEFYRATTYLPRAPAAYQYRALFWERLGNAAIARHTLRSLLHVVPDAVAQRQLDALPAPTPEVAEEDTAPLWHGHGPALRILLVLHPESEYGSDVLYDGLCTVLGDEHVVEFPFKPSLHGAPPTGHEDYPCVFNRPGTPADLEQVSARLRGGHFDVVLYSDTLGSLDREAARTLAQAAGPTPVFVLDMWDQCGDYVEDIAGRAGLHAIRGHFKREMLSGVAYSPQTFPLPLAFPADRVPAAVEWDRREGLFWAGQLQYGARRLALEWLRDRFGLDIGRHYTQDGYVAALRQALIGFCLFGNGFDTVRYWELPAQGCMLLAQRPPIRIPHNFRDGESAVFFDDLPELEEKLEYYLAHPAEVRAIAQAGHEHFKRYHTGVARARQLLAGIAQVLAE